MALIDKKYYHNIDLDSNELKAGRIYNLTTVERLALSLPTTDKGYVVYDTTLLSLYIWNGTTWTTVAGGVGSLSATGPITVSSPTGAVNISTSMSTNKLIGRSSTGTGVMEEITVGTGLTLSAGTLSATSTGIPHATASGTDTYTTTITGVTAYTDGDAYIIQFTNGNTDTSTLNINSLGARSLYRNNDGSIIGGDIVAGGEMLCVYDNTITGFRLIGTSPNTLYAYVVNADSVTITRGQPVYAFGSTGNRMSVKLAYNTTDLTSAQTYGLVYSSSIAANQKGIIIIQGVLDGLNLGGTWVDGDPVYLGSTAGSLTKTKPYAPNHLVYLGVVERANAGNGIMYVRVQNGYELDELHNVQAQSPATNDVLYYFGSNQWKTASISTILGYTPIQLTSLSASSPLSYNNLTGVFSIQDAAADGSTKGAATFTASDFNSTSGVISIDYTNGQAASSTAKGFLTSSDWTTFNGKQNAITTGTTSQYLRGDLSLATFPSFGTWSTLNYPTWTSGTPFVKMTAAGTFSLDTNTYLTSNQSITFSASGDVSGSASGTTSLTPTLNLATITQSTGSNFVKITLDTKGRVTGNTAVGSSDITTALGYTPYNSTNPSGYINGNQTITLSGDISGSGSTAITTTIGSNKVINSMLAQAGANTLKGNNTGATANVTDLTATQVKTLLAIANTDVSGLGTMSTQNASGVSITGGSISGLTTFAIRNAGTGAFDMTETHNGTLTAGRTLTWNLNNAARTISLSGNLTVSSTATISGTNTGDQTITLTGDVTGSGTGSFTTTIANSAVTLAKMANLAANSILGNNTGSSATPLALTGTQVTAMLDNFTSTLKGLVPLSGGGTTNFLRADGTWAAPPGGGGGGTPAGSSTYIQYNNAGSFGASSSFVWDFTNSRLGIGITIPTHKVEVVAGILTDGQNALKITATMPTTITATNYAVDFQITSAGSSSQTNGALNVSILPGYTGTQSTNAINITNTVTGGSTDVTLFGQKQMAGFMGSSGSNSGTNTGNLGSASNALLNIGLFGMAITAKNSGANIGTLGAASNTGTSPIQIGGYFQLGTGNPTFTSAALMIDNGSTTDPIFLARDNGTAVFTIADGGSITMNIGSDASYDMYYRGSGNSLTRLANSTVSGNVLTSTVNGAPSWKPALNNYYIAQNFS